jgi:PIN domain nuclease of toxin-antitoxin system
MARYLLDSNAFLWVKTNPDHGARREAIAEIADPANDIFVSVAAIWELAIKSAQGKLDPPVPINASDAITSGLRQSGFNLLAIQLSHALAAAWLPQHHRDPFDRMMIAQAQQEDLIVITRDSVFRRYDVRVLAI